MTGSGPGIWEEERDSYSKMYLEGEERHRNVKILLEGGEDIFGVERREFEYVQTVESCRRAGDSLVFSCLTNRSREVHVSLSFYEHDIFRIRLSLARLDPKRVSIPGMTIPKAVRFRVEQTQDVVSISTGNLRFRVAKKLWSLEVTDASGEVLQKTLTNQDYAGGTFAGEHAPVAGFPQGPLGFMTDERGEVSTYVFMWLFPDEHFYGFGEKFSALDKRGQRIISWNNNPLGNENPRTYKNVPFFMSSRGYGTFIDSSDLIIYQIGQPHYTSLSFEVKSATLDFFTFFGPSFKRILRSYHLLTGRPAVPPKWSFGLGAGGWMSSRDETEALAGRLRRLHIPCDMIHSGFVGERRYHSSFDWGPAFPEPRRMIEALRSDGFRYLLYVSPDVPRITEMFREGESRGYFIRRPDGGVYLANLPYGSGGQVDFSNPGAVRWYQRKLREQMEMGVSGFFADYGEAAPVDGAYHSGAPGSQMHNLYPLLYTRTLHDAVARFYGRSLNWARPGYGPVQRYPIQWDGDPGCNFSAMACVLRAGIGYGMSGAPFWSHEIGGFAGRPSLECYVRWLQFGAFTSHSRIFGWQTTRREPWEFGDEAVAIFRKYFALKYRLIPYIYSYALAARETGLPLMRAMILEHQDDPNCYDKELQYLFGREFLVAPVFNESGRVSVYLPKGRWVDYWSKEVYEGPANLALQVPLSTLPLFVRGDSIIPMGAEAERIEEGIPEQLTLDIYCYERADFRLRDDGEGVTYSCTRGEEEVTFSASPSSRHHELLFNDVPCPRSVRADGKTVRRCRTEREYRRRETGWFSRENLVRVKLRSDGAMTVKLDL